MESTIQGHPSIEAHRTSRAPLQITVCAGCGRMRTVLWMSGDRWRCSGCKNEGTERPKFQIAPNPVRFA